MAVWKWKSADVCIIWDTRLSSHLMRTVLQFDDTSVLHTAVLTNFVLFLCCQYMENSLTCCSGHLQNRFKNESRKMPLMLATPTKMQ